MTKHIGRIDIGGIMGICFYHGYESICNAERANGDNGGSRVVASTQLE